MKPWDKRDDMVVHEGEPFNAEAPAAALAAGVVTEVDGFYCRNHGTVPEEGPEEWRLVVDGLVRQELRLSLDALRGGFARCEVVATLQCAGNHRAGLMDVRDIPGEIRWGSGAISTARWTGVRLADVLERAGIEDGAAHIAFEAPDVAKDALPPQPYGASVPVAKARSGEVLLAWAMNGRPLPPVHGAPLRVVVPGWIGARSVKWVRRVTARAEPSTNYFQATAYRLPSGSGSMPLEAVAVNCGILRAGRGEAVGYAYAGDGRGVARVEVSADGGHTWTRAELDAPPGPWAWQHWRAAVPTTAGTELVARAWDCDGTPQPQCAAALWNPKGYANNAWARMRL
ncbi:sulfite oxidase [Streptomyces gamaensis]|uniref:Sulfite oxidase n=1 Tax=Streptomyces gamaensis TaxID=1763542 RepID=A0ABW0Z232_9ACTN